MIVLCGSSGGIDAVEMLIGELQTACELCIVVALHGSTDTHPILIRALRDRSAWPVREAEEAGALSPGSVIVCSPHKRYEIRGRSIIAAGGRAPTDPGQIDEMLKELVEHYDQGEIVAVILSGAGTDGLKGCRRVVAEGGRVLAQSVDSAAQASMPAAVVHAGLAEFVGSPSDLCRYIVADTFDSQERGHHSSSSALGAILRLLARQGPPDFTLYKEPYLRRRIAARARAIGLNRLERYCQHLETEPAEITRLSESLLIEVTGLFRDGPIWQRLSELVFEPMLDARLQFGRAPLRPLRVWVQACSTGEEAFTVAMLLAELYESRGLPLDFIVFATDVRQRSVRHARMGEISNLDAQSLPAEQLRRWWRPAGANWRMLEALRARIVFAVHDMLSDVPLANIDVVCCRNLLIYLTAVGQDRVIQRISNALSSGGYALLGVDETPGEHVRGWHCIDPASHLFSLDAHIPRALSPATPASPDPRYTGLWETSTNVSHISNWRTKTPSAPTLPEGDPSMELLRTSNESLQCANEELLAVNEELNRVNAELAAGVVREQSVVAELHAIVQAMGLPIVVVTADLSITRFSPECSALVRLRPGDEGRRLSDFAHDLCWPDFHHVIASCLHNGVAHQREVSDLHGRAWLARIVPIPDEGSGARAVVCFVEITLLRNANRLQALVDALPQQVAVLDVEGRIELVNEAWRQFGRQNGADPMRTDVGVDYLGVCRSSVDEGAPHATQALDLIRSVISGGAASMNMVYPCPTPSAELWFHLQVQRLDRPEGGCLVAHTDITPWLSRPTIQP